MDAAASKIRSSRALATLAKGRHAALPAPAHAEPAAHAQAYAHESKLGLAFGDLRF